MINTIINQITFHASKTAIDWLEGKIEELDIFTHEEQSNKFIEMFGFAETDDILEKIGAKSLSLDDGDNIYRVDDETYFLQFESGNYPPSELIKNITDILIDKSDEDYWCFTEGRYWDNDNIGEMIGILECSKDGYYIDETSIDIDFDDDNYWYNQIEPAFNTLEL